MGAVDGEKNSLMGFERQHAAREAAPARLVRKAREHRLVPEMNAVEIADGQRDRWKRGGGGAVGKQHEARRTNAKF